MRAAPYDLYIFDLDGTLVDSRSDIASAVNRCRADLELEPLSEETISGYIGEGVARLMERALETEHHDRLEEAVKRFRDHYRRHLLVATRPYEGVEEVLGELRRNGVRMAVASNKPEAYTREILEGLGLNDNFSIVLGGDSLPARKPDALPVKYILEKCGKEQSRTLFVGDSRVDVQTAKNAGVKICAVTYGLEDPEVLAEMKPDFLAASPREILEAGAR